MLALYESHDSRVMVKTIRHKIVGNWSRDYFSTHVDFPHCGKKQKLLPQARVRGKKMSKRRRCLMTIMMMTSFETTQGDRVLLGGAGGGRRRGDRRA